RELVDRESLARLERCISDSVRAEIYLYYKLRFWEGLTPAEISRVLGQPRKTVYRFRDALNEVVKQCAERLGMPWR
ncbi:MAG: hypothetical protein AAF560_32850, partial [Acidobacteriota bacterium]